MSLSPPLYSPQPFVAYVRMWAGGTLITLDDDNKPQYLQSFTFERGVSSTGTFSLVLTDPNWVEVQRVLQKEYQNIEFQYGYEGGIQSIKYTGFLTEIVPSFTIDAVTLSVKGQAVGPVAYSGIVKTRSWPDNRLHGAKHLRIDEIVAEIAQRNGWAKADHNGPTIEKTKEIKTPASFDGTLPVNKHFHQTRMTDFQFVRMLANYAISDKTKKAGYTTYINFSGGGPTLHFHPLRTDLSSFKTFRFMRDQNSEVISFELEASTANSLLKEGGVETAVPYNDHTNKKSGSVVVNNKNTPEKDKLNSKMLVRTGLSQESVRPFVYPTPAENEDVATALAKSHYMWIINTGIEASMVIMGDPTLDVSTVCTVLIIQPDGAAHYTSGNYLIANLTDNISAGSFTTTMTLTSPGIGDGAEEVVGKPNMAKSSK